MPIWFELLVMLLATYAVGVVIGWIAWGRDITAKIGTKSKDPISEEETF